MLGFVRRDFAAATGRENCSREDGMAFLKESFDDDNELSRFEEEEELGGERPEMIEAEEEEITVSEEAEPEAPPAPPRPKPAPKRKPARKKAKKAKRAKRAKKARAKKARRVKKFARRRKRR
jgi:hypothetical protein